MLHWIIFLIDSCDPMDYIRFIKTERTKRAESEMIKVECAKCGGKGNIRAFANVDGGRCFSCAGKGFTVQKAAPKIMPKFTIGAMTKDGEFIGRIFAIKAKNEDAAIKKAIEQLSRGNGYIPTTAQIWRGE